jgi:hypothetical protein
VDDLSPKTKLQSYYQHDFAEILSILKKNRKKLSIDPARREPGEALRAELLALEGGFKSFLGLIGQKASWVEGSTLPSH